MSGSDDGPILLNSNEAPSPGQRAGSSRWCLTCTRWVEDEVGGLIVRARCQVKTCPSNTMQLRLAEQRKQEHPVEHVTPLYDQFPCSMLAARACKSWGRCRSHRHATASSTDCPEIMTIRAEFLSMLSDTSTWTRMAARTSTNSFPLVSTKRPPTENPRTSFSKSAISSPLVWGLLAGGTSDYA